MEEEQGFEKEILDTVRKIHRLLTAASYYDIKRVLEEILESDEAKVIYHFSDGSRKNTEIAASCKQITNKGSEGTVSNYHQSWSRLGIVEKVAGKWIKVYDLEDYNIDIPKANGKE